MSNSTSSREASHAGSWYSSNAKKLTKQLKDFLEEAEVEKKDFDDEAVVRAVISPHAGYSYSGPTAAYCYKSIDTSNIQRVFLLGPSHHYGTRKCLLTKASTYETPIRDIQVDVDVIEELYKTGKFGYMSLDVDTDEHSLEMCCPYISLIMNDQPFKLVPIMVGSLSAEKEDLYGQLLSEYMNDEANLFVISSDFCHWGSRFRYQFYNPKWGEIHESITELDNLAMKAISSLDAKEFREYQKTYENTICGRYPIGVLMNICKHSQMDKPQMSWIKYSHSEEVESMEQSSVSYAAGVLTNVQS